MIKEIFTQLKSALMAFLILTFLIGVLYTWAVTKLAQFLFPIQANGSLIVKNEKVIGSRLIGQYFNDPKYFWGRPSYTALYPYNAAQSSGSNLGPTNPLLLENVKNRIALLKKADPTNKALIPIDLVTASGSGLDPDISPEAAYYQAHRIAKARGIKEETVRNIIKKHIKPRQFGFLGEMRVNVLELNLALE